LKRIAVLGPSNNIRVIRWVEFLLKRGHKVDLIYSSKKKELFKHHDFSSYNIELPFTGEMLKKLINTQESKAKIFTNKHLIKKLSIKNFIGDIKQIIAGFIYGVKIYKFAKEIKFDVILIHSSVNYIRVFWYVLISKLLCKKALPIFIIIWGITPRTKLFFHIEKFVFKSATKIMGSKEIINIYLKQQGGSKSKFFVNLWGINLKKNYPADNDEIFQLRDKYKFTKDDVILFHNRLFSPLYNVEDFLDIMPLCIKAIPNLKLLLVRGFDENTPYIDKILKVFEDKGLAKYLHYIPKLIPYDEMRILYGLSLAVVSPNKYGGFCASNMEAMACGGIPVLYLLEGYKDKLENRKNVLFAPVGDTRAFVNNIIYLYQNPQIGKEIKKNNIKLIKEIGDEDINFGRFLDEIEKIVNN